MTSPTLTLGPVTVHFGEKSGKYPDGNQVVVQGRDRRVIFDTPLVANRLDGVLDGVDAVVLGHAHEDHVAGLHLLPDTPVYAPEADVDAVRSMEGMLAHYDYSPDTSAAMRKKLVRDFHYVPRPDAQGYADGAVWELGGVRVWAVHMPGHTRGHSVLMVEPGDIAFIGDIDLSGFGPYYADGCSDLAQFIDTLERIEHLPASAWITSHHKGVITERETFLQLLHAFRGKIDRREAAILEALAPPGRTVAELVAQRFLFPPGYYDVFVEDAERRTVTEHLARLEAQGRVVREGERYRRTA